MFDIKILVKTFAKQQKPGTFGNKEPRLPTSRMLKNLPAYCIIKDMGANTKYKDSVFSFLFSDPCLLRELYCALEGVTLPPDVPVTINTLQDVLFMDKINDISFEIDKKLIILVEHQSTINPNMCLRLLMYIARVYEKIIDRKKTYSQQRLPLPRPEFFVLYNGKAEYPDETIMKLSGSYVGVESLGLTEKSDPALELVVKVINITHGRNEKIASRCKTLWSYSAFVGKVYEYEKEGNDLEGAIKKAINYCLEHDILREFFEKNATEVMNMLLTEWNWEEAKQVWQEESREEGIETTARNALAKGYPLEAIHDITGLDMETLNRLASEKIGSE